MLATVDEISIDEDSDTASVSISTGAPIEENTVNAALTGASTGSGHEYRVKPHSWMEAL